ncbi:MULTISPECIES: VOC family protein [Pandoraea]|uniref:Biphenyl 2,3-dioxygenase n=1 Tax=Pandoraea cepalis TaxID=2508294 RepID=A0AAW7MH61_9BURK|nr:MULTISPECIES: VOC family protein [Pandoraea]ALS65175.1 biphenyl 2,3-dioxygenase [Pandoraea apista]MDN4572067.1 biphenyl 2,3-dioxygenase [Pandoraea cepalis]MDN4576723.1 biphenyl 2,3-dioxygenase [Pandoraea cepalis]RRW92412.1 biphenyl 2,3-dioxygenase [Pandoraea apista]RRX01876.1 biphenyl 2,3-dioxygenase [Pandoraea apista]
MELKALGYLGLRTSKLAEWRDFSTRLLGMQQVDGSAGTRLFRMDERAQRLVVSEGAHDALDFMGWEVDSATDLSALASRLENAGVRVEVGTRALCEQRQVSELIAFCDPVGNRLEAFCSAALATAPFAPGRPLSGFRTGALGMGHVVLHVEDVDALLPFYRDLLGFRTTDYGLTPYKLYFFHLNHRHHSFAMVGSGRRAFHHFMVELCSLDDVGQAYDLAQQEPGRVAYTLGRHLNDQVTSFYVHTPSGFFVEYGWGGLIIDPESWSPHETFGGPSLWGHDRLYDMPEQQKAHLLQMRLEAAANGLRAPNPYVPGF